jgi:hypothetical protein
MKINKMPLSEFLFFSRFTKILLDYLLIKVYFYCIPYYNFFKIQLLKTIQFLEFFINKKIFLIVVIILIVGAFFQYI